MDFKTIRTKYITTTLPYINSNAHIGHALELIQADTLARYFKWKASFVISDVHFNSGLDEHGLKVYQSALDKGLKPKEHCDNLAEEWLVFYDKFHIQTNTFYRTSSKKHHDSVQTIWCKLFTKGDIYKKEYSSKYCVGCEEFKRDIDLVDGKCSIHPNSELETVSEENYFFRLSNYKEQLLKWFNSSEDFILPKNKRNEVLHFLENLEDISISRDSSKVPWGVGVPYDETQTIYVWFDALLNYILSAGYLTDEFVWDDTVQLCGADNIRFQAVIFQGLLCALDIPNTKTLIVHGTVLDENGTKMSKSLGNVVDPIIQFDKWGLEAVRYYLVAGNPTFTNFGYSEDDLVSIHNAHLCNGFGNLSKRVLTLINKKNVDVEDILTDSEFVKEVNDYYIKIDKEFGEYNIHKAYDIVHQLVNRTNQHLNDNEPWKLEDSEASVILKECYYSLEYLATFYSFIFPNRKDIIDVVEDLDSKTILFERL
jgi:methionyl-tRNA synthetase